MRGLKQFLQQAGQGRWAQALQGRQRLQQAWEERVAAPWVTQAWPLRYHAGKLFLGVAASAWASQLRHQQQALIAHLQGHPVFTELHSLHIRVLPPQTMIGPRRQRRKPLPLSARARVVVKGSAADIQDPALRAALQRLAGSREKS